MRVKMFVVIFKAEEKEFNQAYYKTAGRMRDLAINQYACQGIDSVFEDGKETTLSYWLSEKDIQDWKNNAEHLLAQKKGAEEWYSHFSVEIAEIKREYHSD